MMNDILLEVRWSMNSIDSLVSDVIFIDIPVNHIEGEKYETVLLHVGETVEGICIPYISNIKKINIRDNNDNILYTEHIFSRVKTVRSRKIYLFGHSGLPIGFLPFNKFYIEIYAFDPIDNITIAYTLLTSDTRIKMAKLAKSSDLVTIQNDKPFSVKDGYVKV